MSRADDAADPAPLPNQRSYWMEVEDVFDAALALQGEARTAVLDARCAGRTSLRAEVESLLAAHERASGFIAPVLLGRLSDADQEPAPTDRMPSPVTGERTLGHYRLLERVGAGGMGEVFRARDLALGREAALKVLPRQFAGPLRERLLAEAEASAKLQHPAIATFYEAGEADGEAFIAMEFVRGPTLRRRLDRGPLPAEQALVITRCLLEALEHAHAAGLLHRDIKPENVIVTSSGSAKLLDFGIAKPLSAETAETAGASGGVTSTAPKGESRVAGTIGYLAPEQLLGQRLDARTDVFQVAVVLYEMLTGLPAFSGSSPFERLASTMARDPDLDPIRKCAAPPGLVGVLSRALARDRAHRYPSAAAFLRELEDLSAGRAVTALARVVAVCELENRTGDAEVEWLGSAIAEGLRADLAQRAGMTVAPRVKVLRALQALRQRGTSVDAVAVGLHLGCGWAISGDVQEVDSRVKVTLRLLEVATGQVAATEQAEGARDDLFAMQDRLAAAVAAALPGAAIASERRRRGTTVEAHECYARARLLVDSISKGSLEDARVLLERAIAIDGHHVEALGALASTYALRSIATTSTADVEKALAFADRAIAVDPGHVEAYVWKGYALTRLARLVEADAALRQAIDLDPDDSDAHYFAGFAALCGGRRPDALARYQRAVELDSGHGMLWIGLGGTHLCLERRTEALYCFTRAKRLESAPARFTTAGAAAYIGEVLRREGRLEEARAEALAGIEAAERSDHAYRDTFRAHGLTVLGSVALQQRNTAAAEAAFQQVMAQAHGRPRVRACGQFVVRALAGLARARTDGVFLDEALRLFDARDSYNFEPFYGGLDDQTLFELALAALALGRREGAEALHARARAAGSLRPLPPPTADPFVLL